MLHIYNVQNHTTEPLLKNLSVKVLRYNNVSEIYFNNSHATTLFHFNRTEEDKMDEENKVIEEHCKRIIRRIKEEEEDLICPRYYRNHIKLLYSNKQMKILLDNPVYFTGRFMDFIINKISKIKKNIKKYNKMEQREIAMYKRKAKKYFKHNVWEELIQYCYHPCHIEKLGLIDLDD
jgi:hypothetical protein